MSSNTPNELAGARTLRQRAPIFAALGDATRLALLVQLSVGAPFSISELARGAHISRQAITRHLRVLERAGLVRATASGRECHFELEPAALQEARAYLDLLSEQWDEALGRLQHFVEEKPANI
jgi:DNA-binding transcriptional ArsR family regulator